MPVRKAWNGKFQFIKQRHLSYHPMKQKIIIYQVLPRLFGNLNPACTPHGTLSENGCGKMADFTTKRLKEIKQLGANYIWYTGLLEHATQTDYSACGITPDHPAIVKGKAGSPYAIKDYYDIDPDLSTKPERRMEEFESLLTRTHKAGLKVIIDFVPNHVARQYHSDAKPKGAVDLGKNDQTSHAFDPQNNFYYIPNESLHVPQTGTEVSDHYTEQPAKATGNDHFDAWPSCNDWYETIKLNYGVDYCGGGTCHFDPIPDTWKKMYHILLFWVQKGVDAFRCDMAEMVPCAFWSWVIPQLKSNNPNLLFIAEVYNPSQYRHYIHDGHFDYLYDKVGLYDTLRSVACGHAPASTITGCWQSVDDIRDKMLNFLENHDEQRIASDFFAGNPLAGKAAFLVSACMYTNPVMLSAGQEVGERGMDAEGFSGCDGRTTIFDYWSVPSLRRWLTGTSEASECALRTFYQTVLKMCNKEKAIREGVFFDLMYANYDNHQFNSERQYTFIRKAGKDCLLVTANFCAEEQHVGISIPQHAFDCLNLKEGTYTAIDLLSSETTTIELTPDKLLHTTLPAYGGTVLKITMK